MDPSTFTFTIDAFPGYTYFNPTRKVLCAIQIVEDASAASHSMQTVFPHKDDEVFETSKRDSYIEPEPTARWEKMDTTILEIPAQSKTFLEKPVSEMMSADTYVDKNGRVIGTLKYIDNFEAFNSTDITEQSGYYFPVKLGTSTSSGTKMTLIKNGIPVKEDAVFEQEFLLRIDENKPNTAWTIQVDGTDIVSLYFRSADFVK